MYFEYFMDFCIFYGLEFIKIPNLVIIIVWIIIDRTVKTISVAIDETNINHTLYLKISNKTVISRNDNIEPIFANIYLSSRSCSTECLHMFAKFYDKISSFYITSTPRKQHNVSTVIYIPIEKRLWIQPVYLIDDIVIKEAEKTKRWNKSEEAERRMWKVGTNGVYFIEVCGGFGNGTGNHGLRLATKFAGTDATLARYNDVEINQFIETR